MGNERLRERDLAMKVIEKEKGFWAMKVKKKKKKIEYKFVTDLLWHHKCSEGKNVSSLIFIMSLYQVFKIQNTW